MPFPENVYSNLFRLVQSISMEMDPHQEDSSSRAVHHLELNFQWFLPPCSPKESLRLSVTMQANETPALIHFLKFYG